MATAAADIQAPSRSSRERHASSVTRRYANPTHARGRLAYIVAVRRRILTAEAELATPTAATRSLQCHRGRVE
jgi:hypothetical protein